MQNLLANTFACHCISKLLCEIDPPFFFFGRFAANRRRPKRVKKIPRHQFSKLKKLKRADNCPRLGRKTRVMHAAAHPSLTAHSLTAVSGSSQLLHDGVLVEAGRSIRLGLQTSFKPAV